MRPATKMFATIAMLATSVALSFAHPWGDVRSSSSPGHPSSKEPTTIWNFMSQNLTNADIIRSGKYNIAHGREEGEG